MHSSALENPCKTQKSENVAINGIPFVANLLVTGGVAVTLLWQSLRLPIICSKPSILRCFRRN
jgi:hypothetical protein